MAKFKIRTLILFIVFGSILFTGCSLPKRDDISQADHSEARVYASSFTMTDMLKENILTNSPHIMDNACYYQSIEWDAGSQNSLRHFYKFDMDNNISEPLVMDSQESGSTLFALAANEKDIYYIKKVEEDEEIFLCLEKWNGTELVNKQRLENVFAESYDILNFLNGFIIDENLLYLLEADGNVYVFLTDGSYQQNYKLPDAQQYTLVTDGSNNVFGICVESGKTKIYKLEKQVEDAIYEFPAESKGSPIAIESSLGEGLVWWNEEGIYFLNLTEKTSEQVVQWNNEHVNIEWNSVQKVTQISGLQYIILLSYSNDDYVDLARLYQVDESLLPDKKVLTFGMPDNEWGYYDSYISSFNKMNKEYQVVIKTYSNEKESGISALQKEILSGMAPDIIDLSLLSIPELCEKNILQDLAPYFDNSAEIRKEDVPGFIWESWMAEGKVCAVYPDFSILANATWDESQRWMDGYSMEQVVEWSRDNQEINILEDMSIRFLLDYFLTKNLNDFIDWDQKECYFTKDEFIHFLSFIKSQAETENSAVLYDKDEVEERFLNKEFLFYRTVLNDIGTFCNYDNSLGESVKWAGFPQEKGELATRIVATCMIGVNGNSSDKEGAWSFIESMLSSEMQRRKCLGLLENGLSIRTDVLEEQMNKTYISRTDRIYENKKTATKQQVQQMKKLMEAGIYTSIYGSSEEEMVLQMIQEEIGAFLNHDKTAEETAGLIQNRIQLFLNE